MVLYICETEYQLFNALCIMKMREEGKESDILLCLDQNRTDDQIVDRIESLAIVNDVFLYKYVMNTSQTNVAKVAKAIKDLSVVKRMRQELPNSFKKYDRLYLAGPSMAGVAVYYHFLKKNASLRLSLYEEGIFEYYMYAKKQIWRRWYSKVVYGHYYLDENDELFVHEPQYALNIRDGVQVKKIEKAGSLKGIRETVNCIFNIGNSDVENWRTLGQKKFLYFDQNFYDEGKEQVQERLLSELIGVLGREDLIIKKHPISDDKKYDDKMVSILYPDKPMELVLMNVELSSIKIVFTVCSSAAINFHFVFDKNIHVFFLYEIFKMEKNWAPVYTLIENIRMKDGGRFIHIPKTIEELNFELERLKEKDQK
ncbi:MAG: hypothetical protein K6F53_07290 [Lachnospiraceae bacterium]|nr:hypothetical protein [Lachnospiraceae bacterium]